MAYGGILSLGDYEKAFAMPIRLRKWFVDRLYRQIEANKKGLNETPEQRGGMA